MTWVHGIAIVIQEYLNIAKMKKESIIILTNTSIIFRAKLFYNKEAIHDTSGGIH